MADFGYQLGIPRRKKSQLRNCHHQLGLWAYLWGINFWLMWKGPAHCGRYHPWAGGSGLFGKVPEQAKGRDQEALFLHSFCFKLLLWVFPQWWSATQKPNEPFPSHVDFDRGCLSQQHTATWNSCVVWQPSATSTCWPRGQVRKMLGWRQWGPCAVLSNRNEL